MSRSSSAKSKAHVPLNMRTLDNYPMKYNYDDTNRLKDMFSENKKAKLIKLEHVKNDSINLSNYTRGQFDDAVHNASQRLESLHVTNGSFDSSAKSAQVEATAKSAYSPSIQSNSIYEYVRYTDQVPETFSQSTGKSIYHPCLHHPSQSPNSKILSTTSRHYLQPLTLITHDYFMYSSTDQISSKNQSSLIYPSSTLQQSKDNNNIPDSSQMLSIRTMSNGKFPQQRTSIHHIKKIPSDIKSRLKKSNLAYKVISPSCTPALDPESRRSTLTSLPVSSPRHTMAFQNCILIPNEATTSESVDENEEIECIDDESEVSCLKSSNIMFKKGSHQHVKPVYQPPTRFTTNKHKSLVVNTDDKSKSSILSANSVVKETVDIVNLPTTDQQKSKKETAKDTDIPPPEENAKHKDDTPRKSKKDAAKETDLAPPQPSTIAEENAAAPCNEAGQPEIEPTSSQEKKDTSSAQLEDEAQEEEEVIEFPSFICPSSEEKSKEVRLKAWLQSCTFSKAPMTVPII